MTAKVFTSEFKALRKSYVPTRLPIVLCHGLLGFDKITLPTGWQLSYFNGVKEALEKNGAKVIAQPVPPMASIELRAKSLYESLLENQAISDYRQHGVNIVAHSMGGLDARYMVSKLLKGQDKLKVATVTTLSSPHRGSPIADIFKTITRLLPPSYGAFSELTTKFMTDKFNPAVRDADGVQYFSYGAKFKPSILSPFYLTGRYIQKREGDNDGMVSIQSAQWGEYRGTVDGVDHIDVINMTGYKPRRLLNHNYSSTAMYLYIMDDLAKLGY